MKKIIKKAWRALAARPSFSKINELMFDCSLHGLGILNYQTAELSGERHFVEKLLPLYTNQASPLFLDVGANTGGYTHLLKKFHPSASLFAFEPNPKTCKVLKHEFANSDVVVVNKGLGSEESLLKFYDRSDHGGSSEHGSLYRAVLEDIYGVDVEEIDVEITTLDKYVKDNAIQRITFMKVDTEGHELEVLRGAYNTLLDDRIDLIQAEFNEMNIISRVFFRDLAKTLSNYIPYRLLPNGVIRLKESPLRTELFAFQNIVFVHRRFKPNKAMKPTANRGSSPSC